MPDFIDATLMRSGTSRGLYLLADDLPADREALDRVLLAMMGQASCNQVDGVGGTVTVTNKVAMVSRSGRDDADIDYFFAQVDPVAGLVDYGPTCGNVLTGIDRHSQNRMRLIYSAISRYMYLRPPAALCQKPSVYLRLPG